MESVALVTGAAGGMGQAIVRRLALDGFRVVAVDRGEAPLRALAERLRGEGLEIDPRVVDLADEAQIDALIDGLPPLAALVNSAGLFDERKFFDVSQDDFRRMFEVN